VRRLINFTKGGFGTNAIACADFNDDGWEDFVVSYFWDMRDGHGANISIFYNINGTAFRRITITPPLKNSIWDIDVGDFDGDGDKDILISRYPSVCSENISYVVEIIWNENGTFNYFNRTRIMTISSRNGILEYHIPNPGELSTNDWGVPHIAVADFNHDGYDDFILFTNCAKLSLFLNRGNGTFSYNGTIYDYGIGGRGVATADFNHDGYPDLVVSAMNDGTMPVDAPGYIYIKLNNHSPECFDKKSPGILVATLPVEEQANHTLGLIPTGTLEVLDYNNDGLLDVLLGEDNCIFMFIQRNNFTFEPFLVAQLQKRNLEWVDDLMDGGFAVADFDHDSWDDFVQGGSRGMVRLFINNRTFIRVTKPADWTAYIFGKEAEGILNLLVRGPGDKLVIGPIDVVAKPLCNLSKVEFYVNNKLVYVDTEPPFTWKWSKPGFGKYLLYVKAYDEKGEFAGRDNVVLWKIL